MIDWERIVREAGPGVWRTARRLLGNRADAEEVWQETFAAALELSRRTREPVRNCGKRASWSRPTQAY